MGTDSLVPPPVDDVSLRLKKINLTKIHFRVARIVARLTKTKQNYLQFEFRVFISTDLIIFFVKFHPEDDQKTFLLSRCQCAL